MEKGWKRMFDHLLEVRGHSVASERSYPKNDAIFKILDLKNLYFDMHHSKRLEKNLI